MDNEGLQRFVKAQEHDFAKETLENQKIFSQKYQVYGKWKFMQSHCFLQFTFEEEQVRLPFDVTFSEKTLPWLVNLWLSLSDHYWINTNRHFNNFGVLRDSDTLM